MEPHRKTYNAQAFGREVDEASARLISQGAGIVKRRMARYGAEIQICGHRAADLLGMLYLAGRRREYFAVASLDGDGKLLAFNTLFAGTVDGAAAYPREICRELLSQGAAQYLLYHNHPSGIPTPSSADIAITRRISDAASLLGLTLYDHIVVGSPPETYSMLTNMDDPERRDAGVNERPPPYRPEPTNRTSPVTVRRAIHALPSDNAAPGRISIGGVADAAAMGRELFEGLPGPADAVILMNTKNILIEAHPIPVELSQHERAETVARLALRNNASAVILTGLREPTGNGNRPRVSAADIRNSQSLCNALALLDIRLLDTLILENGPDTEYSSLVKEDLIDVKERPQVPAATEDRTESPRQESGLSGFSP